jgi:hypothetical protein
MLDRCPALRCRWAAQQPWWRLTRCCIALHPVCAVMHRELVPTADINLVASLMNLLQSLLEEGQAAAAPQGTEADVSAAGQAFGGRGRGRRSRSVLQPVAPTPQRGCLYKQPHVCCNCRPPTVPRSPACAPTPCSCSAWCGPSAPPATGRRLRRLTPLCGSWLRAGWPPAQTAVTWTWAQA